MKNINLKVYSFEELSKDAQKVVIENNRDAIGDGNFDCWIGEFINEQQGELDKKGFTDARLHYNISFSQGDCVQLFTGAIDLEALKKAGIYDYTKTIRKYTAHLNAFENIVLDYARFYTSDYEVDDIIKDRIYNTLDLIAFAISEDLEKVISDIEQDLYYKVRDIFLDAYDDKTIADSLTEGDNLYFADGTEYNDAMKIA